MFDSFDNIDNLLLHVIYRVFNNLVDCSNSEGILSLFIYIRNSDYRYWR